MPRKIMLIVAIATVAISYTPAGASKLPHCKDSAHLAVAVTPAGPTQPATSTHIAHLACVNTTYTGPGELMTTKGAHLYLLPDAIASLPGELRTAANTATGTQTVTLTHTINQKFYPFATMTPAEADQLATAIDAAK